MGSLNGRNSQFTQRSPTLPTTPIQESALEHDETSLWYDSPKEKTRHRAKSQQVSAFSNTALKGNSTKAHLYHPLVAPLPQKAPLFCCQSGKRPDSSSLADGLRASAIKSTLVRGGHTLKKQHARLCTRVRSLEGSPQFRSPKLLEICPRAQQSASTRKRLGEYGGKVISAPSQFQHITHTHPLQFEMLNNNSYEHLISEFAAIRASQRPKPALRGIQVVELPLTGSQSEKSATHQARSRGLTKPLVSDTSHLGTPVQVGNLASVPSDSYSGVLPNAKASGRPFACSSGLSSPGTDASQIDLSVHSTSQTPSRRRTQFDAADSDKGFLRANTDVKSHNDIRAWPIQTTAMHRNGHSPGSSDLLSNPIHWTSNDKYRKERKTAFLLGPQTASECRPSDCSTQNVIVSRLTSKEDRYGHSQGQVPKSSRRKTSGPKKKPTHRRDTNVCSPDAVVHDSALDRTRQTFFMDADNEPCNELLAKKADAENPAPFDKGVSALENTSAQSSHTGSHTSYNLEAATASQSDLDKVQVNSKDRPSNPSPNEPQWANYEERHRSRIAKKTRERLCIVPVDSHPDINTLLNSQDTERDDVDSVVELYSPSVQASSLDSGSGDTSAISLKRIQSYGSMLSSTPSTLRTDRSSSSLVSVPDLVFSRPQNREYGNSTSLDKADGTIHSLMTGTSRRSSAHSGKGQRPIPVPPPIPCLPPTIAMTTSLRSTMPKNKIADPSSAGN